MEESNKLLEMAQGVTFDDVGVAVLAIGSAVLTLNVLVFSVKKVIRQVRG